jgi:hypothetical protein
MVFLSACAAETSEAQPTAVPSVEPTQGALDVGGFSACSVLDDAALHAAYVDPASAVDDSTENATSCLWRSQDGADNLAVALSENFSLQRIDAALQAAPGSERLTVKGYPAAREGPADSLICTIYTAVSDSHLFSVEVGSRSARPETPCRTAERVAGVVVDALSKRSR